MMTQYFDWAKTDKTTLIVANTELASQEWVDEWTIANPDSGYEYIKYDPYAQGYAGIGFTYVPTRGMFKPPKPVEDYWEWDDEAWEWVNPNPQPDDEG